MLNATALNDQGIAAAMNGRLDEAIRLFRQAALADPASADVRNNLGNALKAAGMLEPAIAAYREALWLRPTFHECLNNLGIVLNQLGRPDEAIDAHRRAIQLVPANANAYNNLGIALASQGKLHDALEAYRHALQLSPDYSDALSNMGTTLADLGRTDEAVAAQREALRIAPQSDEIHNNLGIALMKSRKLDAAVESFERAIQLNNHHALAHRNLAVALAENEQYEAAVDAYHRALRLSPNWAEGHWNLALVLLLLGRFREGWAEYEWRWQWKNFPTQRRSFSQPLWRGEDLNGRTLLLHFEQGFGDTIQFVRYASLAAGRGGRVILLCQPELIRLMHSVRGPVQITTEAPKRFDFHCPLLSLPGILGTVPENIAADIPYLKPPMELAAAWGAKLANRRGRLRVGLVWAGIPKHAHDHKRSLALDQLAPLARVPGVTWFSLQKGQASAQLAAPPPGMEIIDFTADLHDFADTAALISHLDLVIAVDTAVAHLAGAMGKPVWLLLQRQPDWRWMLGREDSPWYPTVRLFRQTVAGRWDDVIDRMAESLAQLLASASRST